MSNRKRPNIENRIRYYSYHHWGDISLKVGPFASAELAHRMKKRLDTAVAKKLINPSDMRLPTGKNVISQYKMYAKYLK